MSLEDLLNNKLEYEEGEEYRHLVQLRMVLYCARVHCIHVFERKELTGSLAFSHIQVFLLLKPSLH